MKNIEFIGTGLLALGIIILTGYGVYNFFIIEEIPLIIRAASLIIGLGIVILLLSLIRERVMDWKKETKSK